MSVIPEKLPVLYVEGADDVGAIAALLKHRGIDTKQGEQHLLIKKMGGDDKLLDAMPGFIANERTKPVGFIIDIDIELRHRWQAVLSRLQFEGNRFTKLLHPLPKDCPEEGYVGQVVDSAKPFGVWLMPDCKSNFQKLEDLMTTLLPTRDILYSHAITSTDAAKKLVEDANKLLPSGETPHTCYGESDRIKAVVRTWLAWQKKEQGMTFGAAINDRVLGHNSTQAMALLDWMKRLYGFKYI